MKFWTRLVTALLLLLAALPVSAADAEGPATPPVPPVPPPATPSSSKPADASADVNLAVLAKGFSERLENDRPLLFIPKLDAPKALTGDLKDRAWTHGAKLSMVMLDNGKRVPATFKTEAFLFCTKDALYVGVRCEDPDPAHTSVAEADPWLNDSIEFFMYPGENCAGGKLYYQVCIDTDKNVFAAHTHMYPRHDWAKISLPWEPNIECAVVKGEKAWTMEFKLNYSDLELTPEAVAKNTLWRMHLVRNRPARGDLKVQNYAWMPTDPDRQNHLPWRWGYILPETHATPKLIDAVIERGKEVDDDPLPPELGD